MAQEGCVRDWPKRDTPREVPAPQGQPEGSCRGLPGAEETTPEPSNSIQQLHQETEARQPQGQRQALVLEPQHGEPRVCQDTQQQELESAEVLATTEALKRDLDFCRNINRKQLAELQQQECAVEQEHQDLVLLMQQFRVLKDKVSDAPLQLKDQAVQTEVTSCIAAHSHSDTSHDIPVESRQQLEQLGTQEQSQGLQHSPAQLQEQSGATQAQEQQRLQQLGRPKETVQGLQEAAELQQQLCGQVQDTANLQEPAQGRQESAKQERKTAVYETQRQQLHPELRKMQSSQEQSRQEERLQELSRQAQHWQQLHVDSERALALREDELVVCKVELAFLKEELSKVLHGNNLTAPSLHNSAELPPPNTHLWHKKQCKIKQGLD